MTPTIESLGIDRLPVEHRIALMHAIWESIERDRSGPLITDRQREELDRRLADHLANPQDAIPWEQVKAEALARLKK